MKAAAHLLLVVITFLGVTGCSGDSGPKLAKVQGKVTSKGVAIEGANVSFVSEKGLMSIGVTAADGTFSLNTQGKTGAPIGKALVGISKPVVASGANPSMKPEDMMKMGKAAAENPNANKPTPSEIASKYANPKTSGLSKTVDADSSKNKFDFEVAE